MANDSIKKTLIVASLLCLVCSILVSTATVLLRPRQKFNQELDIKKNILLAASVIDVSADQDVILKEFQKIKKVYVDISTGNILKTNTPQNFDLKKHSKDAKLSVAINSSQDIAGIQRRPKILEVYFLYSNQQSLEKIILPVYGKGLWSTLYGFLALKSDFNTVSGLTFYEHGETPGLGGEVDNPLWKNLWNGKKIYDDNNETAIEVIKGVADRNGPRAKYQIDGLSGATITGRGVSNLIRFWMGENGLGSFINKLKASGGRI